MRTREIFDDADVAACHPVMCQLRPHVSLDDLVTRVRRQRQGGYRLAATEDDGRVTAVAGFRLLENLGWGRVLYVDDLVSDEGVRGRGHAHALFEWLVAEARRLRCEQFHLDSGVQRFGAHRFYLRHGMDITSHHFAMPL